MWVGRGTGGEDRMGSGGLEGWIYVGGMDDSVSEFTAEDGRYWSRPVML